MKKVIINEAKKANNIYYFKVSESSSHDLVLLECGHEECEKEKDIINTIYYYYAFHVVVKGKGYYEISNKKYELKKNSIFCFFPGEKIKYYPDKSDPWEYYWANFSGLKAKDFVTRSKFTPQNPIYELTDKSIVKVMKELVATPNTTTRDMYTVSALYNLFAKIIDNRVKAPSDIDVLSNNHVVNAMSYITNNLSNPQLSLKMCSNYLGISEVYLSKLFKRDVGLPFSKILNSYRIQKACDYLEKTNYTIKEISYLCGYMSPFYFDKKFNEIILTTPSKYKSNFLSSKSK